jgi:hypothetical protein
MEARAVGRPLLLIGERGKQEAGNTAWAQREKLGVPTPSLDQVMSELRVRLGGLTDETVERRAQPVRGKAGAAEIAEIISRCAEVG